VLARIYATYEWLEIVRLLKAQIPSPSQRSSSRKEAVLSELFLDLRSMVIERAECYRGSSWLTWQRSKERFYLPRRAAV
jgi:hypothetical protein